MSMLGGPPGPGAAAVGEKVASFSEYEKAQKAVSKLIAADVAARDIAIVGSGLRSIERVTGKLGYATAARSGAINGVLIGLFFSAILVFGNAAVPIQAFVGVLFLGIAVGMILSLITYSFVRRRRDYASVMQVVADHYDVTVAAGSIHRARQVLGHGAPVAEEPRTPPAEPDSSSVPQEAAPPAVAPPASDDDSASAPPRYGERVVPPAAEEPQSSPADER